MKRTIQMLTLTVLMLASMKTEAQTPSYKTLTNIAYQSWDGTTLLMDIDIPVNQGPGPFPAIICIHGGGWTTGGRNGVDGRKEALRGYVIVRPDYRLADSWYFPEHARDIKVAIRFIKKRATAYRIDKSRIGLFGYSAGAHLATLVGTSYGDSYLEGTKGYFDVDSRVQSIAAVAPATDLSQLEGHFPSNCQETDTDAETSVFHNLFGVPPSTVPDLVRLANPVSYLTPDDPPLFLAHGTEDCVIPFRQSELLYEAYRDRGLDATLFPLSAKGHNISIYGQNTLINSLRAFWDRTLKN